MARRFCTVINCMDGRVQLPVITYLKQRFSADYVDSITEPGPNLVLAGKGPVEVVDSILRRLHLSIRRHNPVGIAVVGHYDCAGNPASEGEQHLHIRKAVHLIRQRFPGIEVVGLWVDRYWRVHEVDV